MRYGTGQIGRVVVARFDHGEAVVPALVDLCRAETIRAGWFFLIGAVEGGRLVCGPKEAVLPPDPDWRTFGEPYEIVGMGSVAEKDGAPSVHLHASLGRGTDVLTGCIRREGNAFIVVEAMILEVTGVAATRAPDDKTGLELLSLA
ncbi:MAG: PPC domain-containing DNA-binding protein [Gemmatimonadota bacterium]